MDPPDDDIEFDFFDDEPATGEAPGPSRMRIPRPPRRERPPMGPPRGTTPLLRLGTLVVVVIALILVFALLINSCGSSKQSAYASYMSKVDTIAHTSTTDGTQVANALTGLKVTDVVTKLRGIAATERQNVQAAQNLVPPGPLRPENAYLVEALQLRVNGIDGLATTFERTANSKNTSSDATLLAEQADRLLASDVVWDDFFVSLTTQVMKNQGVTGVSPPESHVATSDLVTPHSMALVLERLRGASTGGGKCSGLHGTNIVGVKALPAGSTLSTGSLNTVTASTDLAFTVTVQDSGNFLEANIPVTLTIEKGSAPIAKTVSIQSINPGESKDVTFTGLGQVPFATQTTVKVDVKPVPCEANVSNNSAQYPVIFSLPG
ncbi:MAG: hypothetical protein JO186_08825 [Actinobacteria bacterium]|nr:hypothetical protein [Actinomycetota bacterium]MBV8397074.1 hypothetical protein [Actinomycetota bacterium]